MQYTLRSRVQTGSFKASTIATTAGQIAQGITFDHILDKIRDSVGHNLERIRLLTKKDMSNIERAFGGNEKHKDDATSVKLWVEEMKERCDYNPVLLYKSQHSTSKTLP